MADIRLGYDVLCNSNAKGGYIVGEMTHHAMVTLQGKMLMGGTISGDTLQGEEMLCQSMMSLEDIVEMKCCAMATLHVEMSIVGNRSGGMSLGVCCTA